MGVFWRGLPLYLLNRSSNLLGPEAVAIETGTYRCKSAILLGQKFIKCTTIELDVELASRATQRLSKIQNISVIQGTTREVLQQVLPNRNTGLLVWLDAHFSGGVTAGEDDKCPLMAEIKVLMATRAKENTIILIDDARALIGHGDWPMLSDVVSTAVEAGWAAVSIDDVLVVADKGAIQQLLPNIEKESRLFAMEKIAGNWKTMSYPINLVHFVVRVGESVLRVTRRLRNRSQKKA
jgi:hypothetical protein